MQTGTHPIRPLDLNLLAMLGILLQTRSVSRAAERLGVSQPTVSRSLAQLRDLLADPLLVRSGGGMTLTQRGVELAKPLEEWLALTSTVLEPQVFAPADLDRTFRIATTDFGVLSVVSPALAAISAAAPLSRVEIAAFSGDMFKKLVAGELDVIITGFEPDLSVTHSRHLFRETQALVMRADHPLALRHRGGLVPLEDYLAWPHIAMAIGDPDVDHVHQSLGERAAERRVVARLPYFYAAPDLLGASDAILTIPRRAADRLAGTHGLACLDAPPEAAGFDYWALWHERSARDLAIGWLVDTFAAVG